jgi:hypothetical protein
MAQVLNIVITMNFDFTNLKYPFTFEPRREKIQFSFSKL